MYRSLLYSVLHFPSDSYTICLVSDMALSVCLSATPLCDTEFRRKRLGPWHFLFTCSHLLSVLSVSICISSVLPWLILSPRMQIQCLKYIITKKKKSAHLYSQNYPHHLAERFRRQVAWICCLSTAQPFCEGKTSCLLFSFPPFHLLKLSDKKLSLFSWPLNSKKSDQTGNLTVNKQTLLHPQSSY